MLVLQSVHKIKACSGINFFQPIHSMLPILFQSSDMNSHKNIKRFKGSMFHSIKYNLTVGLTYSEMTQLHCCNKDKYSHILAAFTTGAINLLIEEHKNLRRTDKSKVATLL